jgi:WD40 repeat protein
VQYGPGLGDVIAAGAADGRIHFICAQTGEKILSPLSCDSSVLSIDWHENRIVAGCYDGTIKVFDAQSGDRLSTVRCDNEVLSVAYSADGTKLAAGLGYPEPSVTVVVFNTQTNEQICSLSGHDSEYDVNSVCWNNASDGTTVRHRELEMGTE